MANLRTGVVMRGKTRRFQRLAWPLNCKYLVGVKLDLYASDLAGNFVSLTVTLPLERWMAMFSAVRLPVTVLLLYELSLRMHSPIAK